MIRRAVTWLSSRIAPIALGASAILASPAEATWSIILIDLRTGEVALGSATCLTNFDLQAGTPVLLTGIGGATAQSFVDSTGQNRTFIRDCLDDAVVFITTTVEYYIFYSFIQCNFSKFFSGLGCRFNPFGCTMSRQCYAV